MATTETATHEPVLDAHLFWYKNRGLIVGLLVFAILCIVAFGLYKLYTIKRATSGAEQLSVAKTESDYQGVIKSYGDTPAGASAYLFLSEMQRAKRQFAESQATLEAFVKKYPRHEMVGSAKVGIATSLEAMGKIDEAIAMLQKAASDHPKGYVAPLAMISQVPLLRAKNRTEEARRVCETILTQYRESMWSNQAMLELRSLKPAGAPADSIKPPPPAIGQQAPAMLKAPPTAAPGAPPAAGATAPPAPKATPTKKK